MNKMAEACIKCECLRWCVQDNFNSCPRIEAAADGLGIPFKPKLSSEWVKNIPFGVFQGMKHLANKMK